MWEEGCGVIGWGKRWLMKKNVGVGLLFFNPILIYKSVISLYFINNSCRQMEISIKNNCIIVSFGHKTSCGIFYSKIRLPNSTKPKPREEIQCFHGTGVKEKIKNPLPTLNFTNSPLMTIPYFYNYYYINSSNSSCLYCARLQYKTRNWCRDRGLEKKNLEVEFFFFQHAAPSFSTSWTFHILKNFSNFC